MNPKIFEMSKEGRNEYLHELQERSCCLTGEERKIMYEMQAWNKAWKIYEISKEKIKEQEKSHLLQEIDNFYDNNFRK